MALTLALALGGLSGPRVASAQIASVSPSALGTANNYTALARGFTAIALNPAGLAMPGNPGFSLTLVPAQAKAGLSAMTLGEIAQYDGQKIPDTVKQQWLQTVIDDGGFGIRGGASLSGLALSFGPVGLQISTVGEARANLSPDAFELMMFGNAGVTGTPRDMSLAGTSGNSWGATTGALAVGIPLPGVRNGSFGMGVTLKYTIGHMGMTALDAGSVVRANPFSIDLQIPSISPSTFDYDGLKNNGSGIGMDFGLAWEGSKWAVSAAVQNVFNTFQWDLTDYDYRIGEFTLNGTSITSDFTALPATTTASAIRDALMAQRFELAINMGIAYRQSEKLALTADFRHDTGEALVIGERSSIGLGMEWKVIPFLPLRAGISRVSGGGVQLGVGVGLKLGPVRLSGAYLTEKSSAGEFTAASLALSFGQ